jgi:hypothetical protein
MRTKRIAIGMAVLLAGIVAGFLLFRRAPAVAPVTIAAVEPPEPSPAPLEEAAPSPSPSPQARVQAGVAAAAPEMLSITRTTADDYRRRARFPPSSGPIEDGVDPIVRDREVTKERSLGPEGQHPTLVVFPARASFEAPGPIVLHAYLVDDERRVPANEIVGEVRNQEAVALAAVVFTDDGLNGDAEADDLLFTAVLAPSSDAIRLFKGSQLVLVRAETFTGEARVATTGFLYSVPLARLTGRYRDALVDGHLVVSAEVEVSEPSTFHLEATLGAADGTPIAWAQTAAGLDAGTAWMSVTYWGLILREIGADGPYQLRSVALSTTGEMPNQKNDVAVNAFTTRPYRVAQFSEQPFDDPDLLEAARRLDADTPFAPTLEAGVR